MTDFGAEHAVIELSAQRCVLSEVEVSRSLGL